MNLVGVGLVIAALFALCLQLMDAVFGVIDAVTIRDIDEPDALTRRRFRELFWTLAVTATLAVLIAFGVDGAARLIWDSQQPVAGAWVLVASAFGAFGAGLIAVRAVLGRERPTYARIRRDLRDRSTFSVDAEELADFEDRLDRADRIRRRHPMAAVAVRLIGLVLVLGVASIGAFTFLVNDRAEGWLYLGGGALEIVAFVVALRAASVRRGRLDVVLGAQRAEVVAMLERARIPQRGRVPSLRDRVSRALAILREKQR
ncbi:MAG: hypothetical protein ABIR17_04305 [Pseudolysinimonas sp.]|uniref:hypothetical protein n=1 Tax=Pseudolysinimonas sp. TaxID=2680009 RepID=UPI0032673258